MYKKDGEDYLVSYDTGAIGDTINFSKAREQMPGVLPKYSKYFDIFLHPRTNHDQSNKIILSSGYTKTKVYKIAAKKDGSPFHTEKDLSAKQIYYTTNKEGEDKLFLELTGVVNTDYGYNTGKAYTLEEYLTNETTLLKNANKIEIYFDESTCIEVNVN